MVVFILYTSDVLTYSIIHNTGLITRFVTCLQHNIKNYSANKLLGVSVSVFFNPAVLL